MPPTSALLADLRAALEGGPAIRPGEASHTTFETVDGAAAYLATSGSTRGRPSIVALSAANLLASAEATHAALGGGGAWLLTVPADHVAGIMVLVRAIAAGTEVTTTEGPFRAETFTAAVGHLLAGTPSERHYCSLVPTQLRRVLADPSATEAAAQLDAVLVGGAATAPGLLRQTRAAGIPVVTTYGMTETAGGCVYDGVPLSGVQITLDGDARISISGAQVALGYASADGLQPFDGTVRTADRGRWVDGRLEILGRADDVILTGGVNVDPRQVERVLEALPEVAEAAVVGVADPEWGQAVVAVVVPSAKSPGTTTAQLTDALRAAVRARLGAAWAPRRVLLRAELPLRGPGKVDRQALIEWVRTQHDDALDR